MTKIYLRNGQHKEQEKVKSFYGNSLFASDSMVELMTTSRKDDLESLMYILCYLYSGKLPIIEFINKNIDKFHMSEFLKEVLKYRKEKKQECHARILELLPDSIARAFNYIIQLDHKKKPDYNLIKWYMVFDENDTKRFMKSKLKIENKKVARDILYDYSFSVPKQENQANQVSEPRNEQSEHI